MLLWKLYTIVASCLLFLLFAAMAACSQPSTNIEKPSAGQKPAEFEVGPITIEPPGVMVGDTVTVTATVSNIGGTAGTHIAALSVDGQEVNTKAISVDPGSSQQVSFQLSQTTAGNYQLAIGTSTTALIVYNWTPYTIQYDHSDGVPVCIYVSGDNGHIVRFTPDKEFRIRSIKILGTASVLNTSEFDENHITVRIWDKDGSNQLWSQDFPWRLFMGPAIWRQIEVPEVRVNDDFYVELVTHSNPAGYTSDGTIAYGGNPVEFVQLSTLGGMPRAPLNIVAIGFDYPQSYISSPSSHPITRSGYSYMGKLIDPGQERLEGINWLIRVEGEGTTGN
jgi:hypothetical protein